MTEDNQTEHHGTKVLNKFASYGLIGGLGLGALLGVLISGPHFFVWSVDRSILTIIGCTGMGCLLGFLASKFTGGAGTGGFNGDAGNGIHDFGHFSGGDGGHCSGGDGGHGGGDGGACGGDG